MERSCLAIRTSSQWEQCPHGQQSPTSPRNTQRREESRGRLPSLCVGQDPLIYQIPPEVLLQFFKWYTVDESMPVPWEFTQSPTAILHVCSAWRSLAIAEPDLWRNVLISLNHERKHFTFMLEDTLLRSNGRQLAIQISGHRIPSWMGSFTDLMLPIWERVNGLKITWRGLYRPVPPEIRCFYEKYDPAFMLHPCLGQFTELVLDGINLPVEALFLLLRRTPLLEKLVYKPIAVSYAPNRQDILHPDDFELPRLTHLTIATRPQDRIVNSGVYILPARILIFIQKAPLSHLAFVCIDQLDQRPDNWVINLESDICKFADTLISLRMDIAIPADSMREILSECIFLEELIAPFSGTLDVPHLGLDFGHDGRLTLPLLKRIVYNGNIYGTRIEDLESRGALTVRHRDGHGLRDVLVIWDLASEAGLSKGVDEIFSRVERLNEGGMRVVLQPMRYLDCEVDLAQRIR